MLNVTYETTDKGVKCEAQTGYVHAMNGDKEVATGISRLPLLRNRKLRPERELAKVGKIVHYI